MNLNHLRYFWTVSRMGGVARAADHLNLTPQTVSGQIKRLEAELGTTLFQPAGRGLELTEAGRLALSFAEEMLTLGDELKSALATGHSQVLPSLRVGIAHVVPKSLAYHLLSPLNEARDPIRLLCREGPIDLLLAELALHRLDLVVADRPIPAGLAVHGHSHRLGESPVGFFAAPGLIPDGVTFPACLDDAPLLLPGPGAAVRGQIERWLSQERLKPCIRGEFDNGALMKDFGQAGAGYFPAPISLAEEICARYGVRLVGAIERIRESFWLITVERRISHPAIRLLIESARDVLTTVRPASP